MNINAQQTQSTLKIVVGQITATSVDKAYLGMEIDDLKKTYSNLKFTLIPLFEYGIDSEANGLLLSNDNKPIMFVWTMQGKTKIEGIFCLTDSFETTNGIKVGLNIKKIIKEYPKLSLSRDCLEMSHEYTKLNDLGVVIEFISGDNNRVGRYNTDECQEESRILDKSRNIDSIKI
jgi:hypothetical protein